MNETSHFLAGNAGPVLFAAIFAEQIGIPIPAAPLLVAAGTLAADGAINPAMAIAVAVVASVAADLIWFYIGRRGGGGLFRFIRRFSCLDDSAVTRTERLFAQYGMSAVVAAKFVPALGVLIPPLAGAFKIRLGKFLGFDLLGSFLYGIFYMQLGYLFSNEINQLLEIFGHGGTAVATCAVVCVIGFIAIKKIQRRKPGRPVLHSAAALVAVPKIQPTGPNRC